MSVKTSIGYANKTWNVYTGCENGCPWCFARAMAHRLRGRYGYPEEQPFQPMFWESRLSQPYKWHKPSIIFVGVMGELGYVHPRDFRKVLQVVYDNPQHTFLFLTKLPGALSQYNPWPKNAWVGISATTTRTLISAVYHLSNVVATVTYLSCEPLLEPIDPPVSPDIDWLIIGRCTGTKAKRYPTDPAWVRTLVEWADGEDIPVFLKDNLKTILPSEEIRQEWPNEPENPHSGSQ